ncbi:unnamed protein product, partial [Brachionus calyciflorus]
MVKGIRSFRKVIREEPEENIVFGERLAGLNGRDFILLDNDSSSCDWESS